MMKLREKIKDLLASSEEVIKDCSLENGAIVAANSDKEYYPKEAKCYRYVWIRDASFICIAADILGLRKIPERFFEWCINRAERFQQENLFYENYHTNGTLAGTRLQIDQNGSILWALWHHFKDEKDKFSKFKVLAEKSANGICSIWKKDHFSLVINDLWEERLSFPDLRENFTYSLAFCSFGLKLAARLLPQNKNVNSWKLASREMKEQILKNSKEYFFRSFGKVNCYEIDASLLALSWPCKIVKPLDSRMVKTVQLIEEKLGKDYKLKRYENDSYDGWVFQGMQRNKGSGFWPLLNFWISIYYAEAKNLEKAKKYYFKVLESLDSRYIPEQIFDNPLQVSVSPLGWAHAMFIIASEKLGYLRF